MRLKELNIHVIIASCMREKAFSKLAQSDLKGAVSQPHLVAHC